MVTSDLDTYTKKKGIVVNNGSTAVILFTPSHIQFAKYGRGPGKRPPLDPILAWVKDRKIQFRNSRGRYISHKGTAFAIQASIAKNGTSNYKKNAPNAIDEAVNMYIGRYNTRLGNRIAIQVEDSVNKSIKKVFPKKRIIKI